MLQEVNLEQALKKAAAGERVLVISKYDKDNGSWRTLESLLGEARFLLDAPDVINEDIEAALPKAAPPPNSKTGKEKNGGCRENPCAAQCRLDPGKDCGRDEAEYSNGEQVSEHGQAGEKR